MERKCSQSIKIPFPIKIFYGTDVIVNLPRAGNMIKNIRLVIDGIQNTLGERIIEKADFLSDDDTLETVYGEFIHVENTFKVPIEKRSTLDSLLCVNAPGRLYMKLPFMCTDNEGFFIFDTEPKVRILFGNLPAINDELIGYLMVDYYVTDSVPKTPYVQKIKQIQRFSSVVTNASSVNMFVYAVGPVYELFFTVKDMTSGEYIDAISNVTLFFGEKERFNLSGHYLRYIEPMKRYGVYLREPMYMYSFCEYPQITNIPSGSTHFYENSVFKIDLLGNNSTYEITIWAQSHNFIYQKETASLMFKSTEMLLDTTTATEGAGGYNHVPLRVSYSDFAGSATVYYSSPYEVSNVLVVTDAPYYTILQDSIIFQKIDSLFTEYTANVTFSSDGFSDTTCYFKFRGSGMYLDKMIYSPVGNWPTHIDQGQNFHYVLDNTFDTTNVVFDTSNIQTFTIDENKNYSFTTYVPLAVTTNGFAGPGSIVSKYDQDMNLLFTLTSQNSNTCAPSSNVLGFYGYNISINGYSVPSLHQGVIVNRDTNAVTYFNAGSSSKVYVDSIGTVSTYILFSLRFESSSSNLITSSDATTNFGNGTARTALVKISDGSPSFLSVLSNANMNPKTAVHVNSEGMCVWAYAYTSSSTLSVPPTTYSTSGGYSVGKFDILTKVREWNVNVACTPSTLDMKLVVGSTLENVYLVAGYTSASTPTLTGFTFVNGNGFIVLKINKYGVVKYGLSFTGTSILDVYPILDNVTGKFMMSVKCTQGTLVNMYNNGVLKYSDSGQYQFFIFDDYGNINSTQTNLDQYFSVPKPIYYVPPTMSTYFSEPQVSPPTYTYWNSLFAGPSDDGLLSVCTDLSNGDVYYSASSDGNYSNIYDKYGDTLVRIPAGTTNIFVKLYSNCVYSGYFIRFTGTSKDTSHVRVGSTYIYFMCTSTASGPTKAYDAQGVELFTFLPSSETTFVVRFNISDGTFDNSWNVIIPNTKSKKLYIDASTGNLFITGIKTVTAKADVFVSGVDVADIPLTTSTYTAFVVKMNSNNTYAWRAYVQNDLNDSYVSVSAETDSSGNVYLSSTKNTSAANINGTATSIPSTTNYSGFIVKFDSSGTYASWYTHIDCTANATGNPSYSRDMHVNGSDEVAMSTFIGSLIGGSGVNETFKIYVNGSQVSTTTKIKNESGAVFKYTSTGTFDWVVRHGIIVSGNSCIFNEFVFDTSDNIIVTGKKQEYQSAVYDRYGSSEGTIPGSQFAPTGVLIKINANGTYSNNYGYIDTDRFDNINIVTIDKYGNILFGGSTPDYPNTGTTNIMSVYDKNGYVTFTNSYDYNSTYGFLLKFNSNCTLNKISL